MASPTYSELVTASSASLGPNEWWVIDHDEGPLWETASKRFDTPVIIFCKALDCDWDDAQEQGYRLNKLVKPT